MSSISIAHDDLPAESVPPIASAIDHRPRAPKFAPASEFTREVTAAVAEYFRVRGISDKANAVMITKTIVVLLWTACSYAIIIAPGAPLWLRWLGCAALGVGYAGLGMAIGHDAIHHAYSQRPWVNKMLSLAFDVMGASSHIWRYTHNITHHTYVNIAGFDLDVNYDP